MIEGQCRSEPTLDSCTAHSKDNPDQNPELETPNSGKIVDIEPADELDHGKTGSMFSEVEIFNSEETNEPAISPGENESWNESIEEEFEVEELDTKRQKFAEQIGRDAVAPQGAEDRPAESSTLDQSVADLKRKRLDVMNSTIQMKPPEGMSRLDLKKWKLEQAAKAKEYMVELEQRLQRLQVLGRKLDGFVVTRLEPEQMFSDLPNMVNLSSDDLPQPYYDPHGSLNSKSDLQGLIENELDFELNFKRRQVNETLSGDELRTFLREEMNRIAISQPVVGQTINVNGKENEGNNGRRRSSMASIEPPRRFRLAWRSRDSDSSEDTEFFHELGASLEKENAIRYEEVVFPRNLEEAVARSCPALCGGFSRRSPFRLKCFQVYSSPIWNAFFAVMTVAGALFIAIDPNDSGKVLQKVVNPYEMAATHINTQVQGAVGVSAGQIFDYICVSLLALEIAIGCIAVGFSSAQSTWLQHSDLHKLDLFILLSTVGEYVGAGYGFRSLTLRPLRILRILKPMLKFGSFVGMQIIFSALHQAGPILLFVAFLLLSFIIVFSILGITILQGSFRRVCVMGILNTPSCASDLSTNWSKTCSFKDISALQPSFGGQPVVTGGYPFKKSCKIWFNSSRRQDDSQYDQIGQYYHSCKAGETCVEASNLKHGLQHFDHIGGALMGVLQGSGTDSFEDIIHRSLESEPEVKSVLWVLWACVIAFSTILSANVFKAVVIVHIRFVQQQHSNNLLESPSSNIENEVKKEEGKELPDNSEKTEETKEFSPRPESSDNHKQTSSVLGNEPKSSHDESLQNLVPTIRAGGDLSGGKIQMSAKIVLDSPKIQFLLQCAIALNIIAVTADTWDASEFWKSFCFLAKLACLLMFTGESILRFVVSGDLRRYTASNSNRFELAMVIFGASAFLYPSARFFDTFPALRGYRLMLRFKSMNIMIYGCLSSLRGIIALCIVLITIGLAFAIIGRYVIGDGMNDISRSNFGTFSVSLMTMFELFTGDEWSTIVYDGMSARITTVGQVFVAVFLTSWVFFCKLLAYPMFITIVLENFPQSEILKATKGYDYLFHGIEGLWTMLFKKRDIPSTEDDLLKVKLKRFEQYYFERANISHPSGATDGVENPENQHMVRKHKPSKLMILLGQASADTRQFTDTNHPPERSLFFFYTDNFVRRICVGITESHSGQLVIVAMILLSSLGLVVTPPYRDLPDAKEYMSYNVAQLLNAITTIFFSAEFAIHAIADGLVLTRNAVLKSGWGIADLAILVLSWVQLFNLLQGGVVAKMFRLLKVLSPFIRIVKHVKSVRVIFETLLTAAAPLLYVCFFSFTALGFFALVGVALFGGKMYRCSGTEVVYPDGRNMCSGSFIYQTTGIMMPRAWTTPPHNFDTVYFSSVTLFRISTHKFSKIIADTVDITNFDQSPVRDTFDRSCFFYVVYIIVGVFMVINIFSAFIIESFLSSEGTTQAQVFYNRFMLQLKKHKPRYQKFKKPEHRLSVKGRRLINSGNFKRFSAACILINVAFMLLYHEDSSKSFNSLMRIQNLFFFVELLFELVLYTVSEGPGVFLEDGWRMFEFLIACGSSYGYIVTVQVNDAGEPGAPIYVFFQCLRIFRLVQDLTNLKSKYLGIVVDTVLISLPQLPFIFFILFLVYAVFALLGVQLFATTRYGNKLGPTSNFDTWFKALQTLFQIFSGDDWMDIMDDCSVQPPYCTRQFTPEHESGYTGKSYSFGDCGATYASAYFLAMKIICEFVLLNLLLGMAIANYKFLSEESMQSEDEFWSRGPSARQLTEVIRVFRRFDSGTSHIKLTRLHGFKYALPFPLGIDTTKEKRLFMHRHDKTRKVAWKLIRAEFNVILRDRRAIIEANRRSWIRHALKYFGINQKDPSSVGIDFMESMMTVLHWRLPHNVPFLVKVGRSEVMMEVVMMSHALTLLDFLRACVALRKQNELNQRLHIVQRVRKWCRSDTACMRRINLLQRINFEVLKQLADLDADTSASRLTIPPKRFLQSIDLDPGSEDRDKSQRNLTTHQAALLQAEVKYYTPSLGLETFLKKVRQSRAILRFVDSVNKNRSDFAADFSRCDWEGWKKVESTTDAILRWSDLRLVGRKKGGGILTLVELRFPRTLLGGIYHQESLTPTVACRLVDIQSYSSPDPRDDGRSRPTIRINLAPTVSDEDSDFFDGVLELVGYE